MSGGPRREGTRRTSVLVLSFDGRQHLDDCLDSLGAMDVFVPGAPGQPRTPGVVDEVCLVDNGSTDGSVARVRERFPWVRILENGENLGFACGYDSAVSLVEAEWVALLDIDARVRPDWLSELHLTVAAHPGCRAVAGRILSWDGTRVDFEGADTSFTGHVRQRDRGAPAGEREVSEREVLFGCGASLLLHRETFLRHGGFDPDYFAFLEDVDLGWRMTLAGDVTRFSPAAVSYHKRRGSFGSRPQGRVRFLCERNALATVFKGFAGERVGVLLLASAALTFLKGWSSSATSCPESRPWLTTDGLAHLLALADLVRLEPALRERRAAAQASRRRSDAEIRPLFEDLAYLPAALGAECREPFDTVVATLGLSEDGFGRVFAPELESAAREAALALAALCARAVRSQYEPMTFFARGYDLDWEHPLEDSSAASLGKAVTLVRDLLLSDFGGASVARFAHGLEAIHASSGQSAARPVPQRDGAEARIAAPVLGRRDRIAVTVVVRTKDRPKELRDALASLAAQTFRDFEVVVIDDGTADAAPALDVLGPVPRAVRLLRTGGVGRARAAQAGLEAARGEFVNYLDDDDTLLPTHLELLVGTQRATGARIVHSVAMQVSLEDDDTGGRRIVEKGVLGGPLEPSRLFFESTLPLMTVLIDRDLALGAGGFDPALDYFEDWDLFLRLTRDATFAHCPHVTAQYRIEPALGHGSGVTGAHRWPFLAAIFERYRNRVSGVDWARFYRAHIEPERAHAAALAGERDRASAERDHARAEREEAAARLRDLEERLRVAERNRDEVVGILRSVERSHVYRVTRAVRRFLGRA